MFNETDTRFENEVRRVARAKWPSAQYGGAEMIEGRERDGVFETDDAIHFIEATTSQSASKAKEDTRKIHKLIVDQNQKGILKVACGWFITRNEPTADQRKQVQEFGKGQVRAVSFAQFQQSLIDVLGYLSARKAHRFGSVKDFTTPSSAPSVAYVEIGLTEPATQKTLFASEIVTQVLAGQHFSIVGHFGAGKSMTLREIFLRLQERYIKGSTSKFPVYINLREHSGQSDPVEILERHARNIGFGSPSSLVRAWRAGFVVLLIDGFDEVSSLGVQGSWKKLKDLRKNSLKGVRLLIRDSAETGVVVTGRVHYFEDERELNFALGLTQSKALQVDEFNETQMRQFLSKFPGTTEGANLPHWLPTRPLLLGYLASKQLLSGLIEKQDLPDAVDGWDYLLERIYEREEAIETNLDGPTLRQILERLATAARASAEGLGPITRSELFKAFNEVCGYEPDEQGILAIQRLPGLGIYRAEDESRCFVDKELAEVCCGQELYSFLVNPYDQASKTLWVDAMNACDRPISAVGVELAFRKLSRDGDLRGSVQRGTNFLNTRSDLQCARGDLAALVVSSGVNQDSPLTVQGMSFIGREIEFHADQPNLSQLTFLGCWFDHINLEQGTSAEHLPIFDQCLIGQITGRISNQDLPRNKFLLSCEIEVFNEAATSDAIRSVQMSVGEKVLLITLRKLFLQSLSGRAENALYRGLDVDERRCVSEVLRLLKRHELATEYSKGDGIIWLPVRKALERVKKIIHSPNECGEQIVKDARAIH